MRLIKRTQCIAEGKAFLSASIKNGGENAVVH